MLPVKSNLAPTISRFFEDDWNTLFDWPSSRSMGQSTLPSVNISETTDTFEVEVAAPGMKKEDFHVEIDNNKLIIKSESSNSEGTEENSLVHREFSYQSFQRVFTLNSKVVDDAKIKAKYVDGILKLTLPKQEEAKVKPARQIKIS